jgi:hypothetical protein
LQAPGARAWRTSAKQGSARPPTTGCGGECRQSRAQRCSSRGTAPADLKRRKPCATCASHKDLRVPKRDQEPFVPGPDARGSNSNVKHEKADQARPRL